MSRKRKKLWLKGDLVVKDRFEQAGKLNFPFFWLPEKENGKNKKEKRQTYQSQVSILGPVGYGPTTLPLRHSDVCDGAVILPYLSVMF